MLMEIWYMIFLSAHLEISLLKFKALTLGVDGQPAGHSFKTPLLEPRRHSLRGPLAGHTQQISILLTNFLTHFKKTLYNYFSCLIK
jgi:hypothetical protein